ncbi:hypothetical protein BKA70DRAFT_1431368 [Coprinopsis sp. MPI-PUGE-AT-0042]|nr:hypothetical protein BKA70DRAFT_1431368 [Coprinopsis sp. MPI-PUGE-AT-0042]
MEHPPADLHVTLADELSTEEELREDPSQARWDETLNILTSLVNTPSAITIDEATSKINDHFLAYVMEGDEGDEGRSVNAKMAEHFPNAFWYYLIMVAGQVPDGHPAQGQLVALIKSLRDLPDPVEYMPEGRIKTERVWADLPDLGMELREAMDGRYTLGLEEFVVRLVKEIDLGFTWMAFGTINRALERPEPASKGENGVETQPFFAERIESSLRQMEIWVGIGGQKLYQACRLNEKVGLNNTGPSFTLDVWKSWKSRIREIKMDAEEPADRREMAERIEALMIARQEEEEEEGAEL